MQFLWFLIYAANKVFGRLASYIWMKSTDAYLRKKARTYNKIHFYGRTNLTHVHLLDIGKNIHVNSGAWWVCEGGLEIGDNCHFGKNLTIYTKNHNYNGSALPYDNTNILKPVKIGKNVWLGANVTVLPGTTIGDGAIIGAGAIVYGTIPPHEIVGAAKPNVIGTRDLQHYENLDANGLYGGAGGKPLKAGDKNAAE